MVPDTFLSSISISNSISISCSAGRRFDVLNVLEHFSLAAISCSAGRRFDVLKLFSFAAVIDFILGLLFTLERVRDDTGSVLDRVRVETAFKSWRLSFLVLRDDGLGVNSSRKSIDLFFFRPLQVNKNEGSFV